MKELRPELNHIISVKGILKGPLEKSNAEIFYPNNGKK